MLSEDLNEKEDLIDFGKIEEWILEYSGIRYVEPEKAFEDDKEVMEEIKELGIYVRNEFTKYGKRVEKAFPEYVLGNCSNGWSAYRKKVFNLKGHGFGKVIDSRKKIISEYLWIELKKKEYKNTPFSISLCINKQKNESVLSVRVEAKDIFDKEQDFVQKVPILKNIDKPYVSERTNQIVQDTIEAVKILLPYYEQIFLKENRLEENNRKEEPESQKFDHNLILYGPPGTGKTYNTIIYAVAICDGFAYPEVAARPYSEVKARYKELMEKNGRIAFTTFHQSYGYEEFIEGIRPITNKENGAISYQVTDGIFKEFCKRAEQNIVKYHKDRYVFIIDEINRGNISKIFGELITLIEESKRKGKTEQMLAYLPYSGDLFGVPDNVYILGTMNTADRSIAIMDTALRRRFQFEEKMPEENLLKDIVVKSGEIEVNMQDILHIINERICFLYDREHTIGHAFFLPLKDIPEEERLIKLGDIFKKSIVPLLQEYFYEDYEKIQQILGDDGKKDTPEYKFILETSKKAKNLFKGITDYEDTYTYCIQESAFYQIESYKGIL